MTENVTNIHDRLNGVSDGMVVGEILADLWCDGDSQHADPDAVNAVRVFVTSLVVNRLSPEAAIALLIRTYEETP